VGRQSVQSRPFLLKLVGFVTDKRAGSSRIDRSFDVELGDLADGLPVSGELRTIPRVQCLGVVRRDAVSFPIQDQAFAGASRTGVTSLKEGEVDHSFDASVVVYSPEKRHFRMRKIVLRKRAAEIIRP